MDLVTNTILNIKLTWEDIIGKAISEYPLEFIGDLTYDSFRYSTFVRHMIDERYRTIGVLPKSFDRILKGAINNLVRKGILIRVQRNLYQINPQYQRQNLQMSTFPVPTWNK
jgi:hypothetical protein